ncbi:MAG: hypothetical protein IT285_15430 [Bdellovibrionales bacterium]|nr:hypothetical protein [Bdellovibrionales bacterium]
MKSFAAPLMAVVALATGAQAFADGEYPSNPLSPMIEVGAGGETQGNGVNVLLHVNVGVRRTVEEGDPDDILVISEQQMWAHMSGDVSFNVSGNGQTVVPYMDIRFVPWEDTVTVGNSEDGLMLSGTLELVPIEIGRNVALDQNVVVQVSVIGVQFRKDLAHWDDVTALGNVTLFAQVAADALGYKVVDHVAATAGTFHGFHLLGLSGAVGANFEISDNFNVRLEIGANADVNFGANNGFAIQSDMGAYAAVRFTIAKFIELFVMGRYQAQCEAFGSGCQGAPQLMFGATFYF